MTINNTLGARCVDDLCKRIRANWFAPDGIVTLIESWREALEAAFEAVAEHDHDRVLTIPAIPDSDVAVNVLANWDDYLGRNVVWDVLEDATAARGAEQAPQEERDVTVVFRAGDLELRVLWFETPDSGTTDEQIVQAAAWFVEDETGNNPSDWAATIEIVRPS